MEHDYDEHLASNFYHDRHFDSDAAKILPGEYYVTGKQILKLLQDTCLEKGVTVVVITHNSAITPMADRVIHIKNGTVESMQCNEHPTSVELIEW